MILCFGPGFAKMLISVALCCLSLALPEAHVICGNVHGAAFEREVNVLPGSCLLLRNSHWVACSTCLLVLGPCEGTRLVPAELQGREER